MTQQELQQIFESEFNWNNWKKVMNFVFPEFQFNLIQTDLARDTKAKEEKAGFIKMHGQTELASHETLMLCEVLVKDNIRLDRNVKSVRSLVAGEVIPNYQAVIAVFHNADNTKWRFTLVVKEFTGDHKTFDKKPDSYTYVFGVGEKGRTAADRFLKLASNPNKTLKDLEEAFSVEALSKKFFKEYKDIYQHFVDDIIKSPSRLSLFKETSQEKQEKSARDFVKKMMGRVVFLYFLQKKGWLGCKTKWEGGDEAFMKTFVEKAKQNDLFYHHYLEPLFFDTLNDKRSRQDEDCIIQKTNFGKVPYLNGGLFEKDENHPHGLTIKWEIFAAFFDTLNNYNFTIVEDDPDFKEVAVDPEMLGHIFENLLEDNKDKGAFYTPKEIVHYMCQESLFEYLKTYLAQNNFWPQSDRDAALIERALHNFVTQKAAGKVIEFDKPLSKALKEVKICDPAIGSGAFPMGLLNEIFHCVHVLYDASPDIVGSVWEMEIWQPNKVKLNIIQNSIYGVDIEKGAVDIARLRFWLSLIVDEPVPTALPNLDYKIVVGNSLVSKLNDDIIDIDWKVNDTSHGLFGAELAATKKKLLRRISIEQKESFNPDSDKKKLAADIRNLKIDLLINQLQLMIKLANQDSEPKASSFTDKKKFAKATENYHKVLGWKAQIKRLNVKKQKQKEHLDFFDWKLDFPEIMNDQLIDRSGFDIVIANPPYINVELIEKDVKEALKLRFDTFYKRTDIFGIFLDFSLTSLLKPDGKLAYIIPSIVLNNLSYKPLRNKILNNRWLNTVFYTGNNIFSEVTVDTVILLLNKKGNNEIKLTEALDFKKPRTTIVSPNYFEKFDNVISVSNDADSNGLFEKLFNKVNINIETHFDVFQGIVTGNNPIFIFDEPDQWRSKLIEKELLKPLLHGRDFGKWFIKNSERRILYLNPKTNISNYPLTKKYILPFKEELSKRRECMNGAIPWYSLQWARDESLLEIVPKIIIQNTRNERLKPRIVATVDELGIYGSQGINFVVPKTNKYSVYFLIGIINSRLIDYLFSTKFLNLAIKADYIKQLGFPSPSNYLISEIEMRTKAILKLKYNGKSVSALEGEIDNLIYRLYDLSYEEVKVVEPNYLLSKEEYDAIAI
ncbi:MAG TPA: N-6 DNA methylase [Cyclobacteriaceae bacterium]|nr:N-6 DNA methylase [Cyclobacteriaceae bacterium]HMX88066.1 N-6 DNA methylase [Saprospiraceae bacterium]HMX00899.1 N-6 DNA methylase [Cyclobacteriaceae bacterium]HMY93703.1 N-6 DNA methylase [Cyclobacteriaceae bacterium]HNA12863.1 N-6 DNA methylase [Cyclobacteriaceae bacterium]